MKFIYLTIILMMDMSEILAQNCQGRYSTTANFQGECRKPANCTGAILNNLCPGSLKCCIPDPGAGKYQFVETKNLEFITGLSNDRITLISKTLEQPKNNPDCKEMSSFVSQLAYESSNFMLAEESGSESDFDKFDSLPGNSKGDGAKYRGRGFLHQLRGKLLYNRIGSALSIDLDFNPELAAFPSVAAKIAVWFWKNQTNVDLNTLADGTFYNYSVMTEKITNGSIKGLTERTLNLERAMETFECGEILKGQGESCMINNKEASCKPLCTHGLRSKKYCGCNGETKKGQCNDAKNIYCCAENCKVNMDLTFVLDSSGSVSLPDFDKSKNFVSSIVDTLNVSADENRIAIINYSTNSEIVTYLNSNLDKEGLLNTIDSISAFQGSTYTDLALKDCFSIYSIENGMRNASAAASKVIIVQTDGKSNGQEQPGPIAEKLRSLGITIYAIGVGDYINFNELKEIGSSGRVYKIEDYDTVVQSFQEINQVLCREPSEIESTSVEITVDKDSTRFFYFEFNTTSTDRQILVDVKNIVGNCRISTSFTDENPNDKELSIEDENDSTGRFSRSVELNSKLHSELVSIPDNTTNDNVTISKLYIGVTGLEERNVFTMNITQLTAKTTTTTEDTDSVINSGDKLIIAININTISLLSFLTLFMILKSD